MNLVRRFGASVKSRTRVNVLTEPICYVAYYRVSTQRQGHSGLGLEAQQKSIEQYINNNNGKLIAEFTDVESGSKKNRVELNKALKMCKREKATLIVAKLDRLTRNVHFITGLMESKVKFMAVDAPYANKLMIHLMAAFAEHEREMISQRTREALRAAKERGVKLGSNGKKLAAYNRKRADDFAIKMKPILEGLEAEGILSHRAKIKALNKRDIKSAMGKNWHLHTLHAVIKRIELLSQDN